MVVSRRGHRVRTSRKSNGDLAIGGRLAFGFFFELPSLNLNLMYGWSCDGKVEPRFSGQPPPAGPPQVPGSTTTISTR